MDINLLEIGKRYRYEWIFKNLSHTLHSGGQYAIIGPNGSGKSTLLRALSGNLTVSKGKIAFIHHDHTLDINDVYQHISYSAPYIELIEEFTLTEAIDFHRKFKPFLHQMQTAELIDLLQLPKAAHKPIRFFSSGMKQRLKLALAICADTSVLLIDEPNTNLDLQGIQWYHQLIERFAADRTIVIASNIEADFEFCSERINILDYK